MKQWSAEQALAWYERQDWLSGCNFIPSTAVNQLEMWQADTFDPETIERELGYAENLGFNTVRVFLHTLVWETDAECFKERIRHFLDIADRHGIRVMFVLFDSCWNDNPQSGKQPEPKPGIHNSGWMQCPGRARATHPETWEPLKHYTQDIIRHFGSDERVLLWDLFNEPSNSGYGDTILPLLENVFEWAREADPMQPISSGVWDGNEKTNTFMLIHSDVITFHNYDDTTLMLAAIQSLRVYGRPIICTEYMARTRGSFFQTHLPLLRQENVGAIHWGLVAGKSNTVFAWDTPIGGEQPGLWFHDIFHPDGTPYAEEEVAVIREVNEGMEVRV
jgi:endo-1,4-beta-mannosidase